MQNRLMTNVVAITHDDGNDGIAKITGPELSALGYHPVNFPIGISMPENRSTDFAFFPHGRLLTATPQLTIRIQYFPEFAQITR